ncbi:lactoylglutathione lyase [Paenibacillus sp. UNCCL117]|uniref:VOC family protein n=1 Tax=unclassified Paenibacillus TaxID=185978 RepID=UPI00089228C0|nr:MULTISPECIES: VOC family protein [unclassified Paenibacillus]SDC77340.1 lactoylglutathione lyase [Paenibacillus sp. cl123]SFW25803.1 lactoylglutathione lyase [Paenibacillus sp. UNCCL117]
MARIKLEHVGIMVKDMETSVRFYEEVIGLTCKETLDHTNGVIKLAFLGFGRQGETELELIQGYHDGLPQEGKVHHVAFTVDDIEEEFKRIQGLSHVRLIDQEITTLPNGSRYFFFHGPDGEWIELFQSTR